MTKHTATLIQSLVLLEMENPMADDLAILLLEEMEPALRHLAGLQLKRKGVLPHWVTAVCTSVKSANAKAIRAYRERQIIEGLCLFGCGNRTEGGRRLCLDCQTKQSRARSRRLGYKPWQPGGPGRKPGSQLRGTAATPTHKERAGVRGAEL